ncbi:MAG: V-type ATP synthase subunit F [Eubacteriales bacterium]
MYKIAVIGDRDSVLGFMALGFTVFDVSDAEEAKKALSEAAHGGEFAVIFITEKLASALEEELARYKDMPLPAIVSIPDKDGSTGYGMSAIRSAALRAVGADILFDKK